MRKLYAFLTAAILLAGAAVSSAQAPRDAKGARAPAAAAKGGKLRICGEPMYETATNYQRYIKYLTVAPSKQKAAAFRGKDEKAIRALENPILRQIFDAMNHNGADTFSFASLKKAQENFAMRYFAIDFMDDIYRGAKVSGVDFDYYGKDVPAQADPAHWTKVARFTFATLPGVRASDAIDGMCKSRFRGECLGAIHATVLQAARKAIGPGRFDRLHPSGLSIPSDAAVGKHLRQASRLAVADMVPGDRVYMKNKDDYNKGLKPGVERGYWTGENALYMGRYTVASKLDLRFDRSAPQRFSGMGVYNVTEDGLRAKLKEGYTSLMRPPFTATVRPITDADIRWTLVQRLETGD